MKEIERELQEKYWEIQREIVTGMHRANEVRLFVLGTLEKVNRASGYPTLPRAYERHYYVGSQPYHGLAGVLYHIAIIDENRTDPTKVRSIGEVPITCVIGDYEFLNTEAGMVAEDSRVVRSMTDGISEICLLGNLPDLGPDLRTVPASRPRNL